MTGLTTLCIAHTAQKQPPNASPKVSTTNNRTITTSFRRHNSGEDLPSTVRVPPLSANRHRVRLVCRAVRGGVGGVLRVLREGAEVIAMIPKDYWHYDPCVWCNRRVRRMSREHIIPLSAGGAYGSENQAMACNFCNRCRANTPLLVWLLALNNTGSPEKARRLINRINRTKKYRTHYAGIV
jgi:hypothetical protein